MKKILILTKNNSFIKDFLKNNENTELNIFSSLYDWFFLELGNYDKIIIDNDSFELQEFNYIMKLFSDFILLHEEPEIIKLLEKTYSQASSEQNNVYSKRITYFLGFIPNSNLDFVIDGQNKKESIENILKRNFVKI